MRRAGRGIQNSDGEQVGIVLRGYNRRKSSCCHAADHRIRSPQASHPFFVNSVLLDRASAAAKMGSSRFHGRPEVTTCSARSPAPKL